MNIAQKIRASRGILDLTQDELAAQSGVSKITIQNIENGKNTPNQRTVNKIMQPLENAGVVFTSHGVEYYENKIIFLYDFLDVLADARKTLPKGGEILFHCADEKRNSDEVTEAFANLIQDGYSLKFTYCEGNDFITTNKENYRWIDKDFFANSDVQTIYGHKYCFHAEDEEKEQDIFIVIDNRYVTASQRKQFEYWWKRGAKHA